MPLSKAQERRVLNELGLVLPHLLMRLYQEVGNGGFGPSYGLLGIRDGYTDDRGNTPDAVYRMFLETDPNDPNWFWPRDVFPICHYGCGIYHCIDVVRHRIVLWEPNLLGDDSKATDCLFQTPMQLSDWFESWLAGGDP
jgi:hypothetical protein